MSANGVGAPAGNDSYRKGKRWAAAIDAALKLPSRYDAKCRLEAIADKMISMAEDGDMTAIRELGDRIDGKVAQAIAGHDGGPIVVTIRHESS